MRRAAALAFALLLAACDDKPGTWSAYVYPDARDRTNWTRTDRFKTKAMCEQAAKESVARLPAPGKAAFKCVVLQPI